MNNNPKNENKLINKEFALNDLMKLGVNLSAFLKNNYKKLLLVGIIGSFSAIVVSFYQTITYTAKSTFIVEDSKSTGGLSGIASLAGQFGVDVTGCGSGLISGDNILYYFKSESLAREFLLSPWNNNQNISFADIYISKHGLDKKWKSKLNNRRIYFPPFKKGIKYTLLHDSLLQVIIKDNILKKQFSISKIDKKASFINLSVTMDDEILAKNYIDKLFEVAITRYINLKTGKQQKTVNNLQFRVDSLNKILTQTTFKSAEIQTSASTMDLNPLYKTNTSIKSEITNSDKIMLTTVYGEVVKNLELAKFTLSQETPVIQIVDPTILPLENNKISKFIIAISGFLLAIFIFIFIKSLVTLTKKH